MFSKWTEIPTVEDWFNVIHDISVMEKLTCVLRLEQDKFESCIWDSFIEFVSHIDQTLGKLTDGTFTPFSS